VRDKVTLKKAIHELQTLDLNEKVKNYRPNSKYVVKFITQIEYYIYSTNYVLGVHGCMLPEYIKNSKAIITMYTDSARRVYPENMCMFLTLARHYELKRSGQTSKFPDMRKEMLILYTKWLEYKGLLKSPPKKFKGVLYDELVDFETCFQINVIMMKLHPDRSCTTEFITSKIYPDTLYAHLFENHVSLITDVKLFSQRYRCNTCDRIFSRAQNLKRHALACQKKTSFKFPGGYYRQEKCIFEKLQEIGIMVPKNKRNFPFFVVWDLESMLLEVDENVGNTAKSKFIHKHQAISCSLCSNAPGYGSPFTVMDSDPFELARQIMVRISEIRTKVKVICMDRWADVLEKLSKLEDDLWRQEISVEGDECPAEESVSSGVNEDAGEQGEKKRKPEDDFLKQVIKIKEQFQLYVQQLTVLSFNGGRYDWLLLREELIAF
jgi:hypothetical protein